MKKIYDAMQKLFITNITSHSQKIFYKKYL